MLLCENLFSTLQPKARASPERHDRHRVAGFWAKAWKGIERARAEGFRVRLAATVATEAEAAEFRQFLDSKVVANRIASSVALRCVVLRKTASR
jgi:hypothetical protein